MNSKIKTVLKFVVNGKMSKKMEKKNLHFFSKNLLTKQLTYDIIITDKGRTTPKKREV